MLNVAKQQLNANCNKIIAKIVIIGKIAAKNLNDQNRS